MERLTRYSPLGSFCLALACSGTLVWGGDSTVTKESTIRQAPRILKAKDRNVGRFIPDLEFKDVAGKPHRLGEFKSRKGLVIAVTSTSCPLSKKYFPTLVSLAEKQSKGQLAVVLVNPVATDKPEAVQEAARELGTNGIYVHDTDGTLASALGLTSTTEVVLLDSARTVQYQGAIDDQYGFGYSQDAPKNTYLNAAIREFLEGRELVIAATEAPGCNLDLKNAPPASSPQATYHNRISRIIQSNCGQCHRDGGVGPFALTTYSEVSAHAGMIETVVDQGTMPPWFAAPVADQKSSPWINDCSLNDADKKDLIAWIAAGKPEGNQQDAPLPVRYPNGWTIGKPDLVAKFPKAIPVQATGTMRYQHAIVETKLTSDKWVQSIEVRPGVPEVVHHVLVFVHVPGDANKRRSPDAEINYWGIYVPGNSSQVYPEGFARKLPKGAIVRFQMHYTPNGKATEDLTQVGFVFADKEPKHEVKTASLVNAWFEIPPGADNFTDVAKLKLPSDVTVLGFLPHMHLRGKACKYEALTPDGKTETLLDVPAYDFNWQLLYRYAEPRTFTEGTTLKFHAWFDNSDKNPANPDPKATVKWGEQTSDEMIVGYLEYYVPSGSNSDRISSIEQHQQGGLHGSEEQVFFQALDENDDSKLSLQEVQKLTNSPRFKGTNSLTIGVFFTALDADKDGFLNQKEFSKIRELMQKNRKKK